MLCRQINIMDTATCTKWCLMSAVRNDILNHPSNRIYRSKGRCKNVCYEIRCHEYGEEICTYVCTHGVLSYEVGCQKSSMRPSKNHNSVPVNYARVDNVFSCKLLTNKERNQADKKMSNGKTSIHCDSHWWLKAATVPLIRS